MEESKLKFAPAEEKQVRFPGIKPQKKETGAIGRKLDQYKKRLNLALQLFSGKSKGKMYDPETGELTSAGDNALDSVLKLIEKADNDPRSLTAREEKKLSHARRAWDLYSRISEDVSAGDEPEEKATYDQYLPQGYATGNPALNRDVTTGITPPPYWEQR